jgi:hypothetical protein
VQHSEESFENGALDEVEDGLKAWGYMPGHVHYKLGQENEVRFTENECSRD